MIKIKWIILVVFVAGVLILILPDKGKPVIRFNNLHGPSFQDMIGLVLIFIGWLTGLLLILKNYKKIKIKIGARNIFLLVLFYLLSCIGIALALKIESDWILWLCGAIALFINTLFISYSFSKM